MSKALSCDVYPSKATILRYLKKNLKRTGGYLTAANPEISIVTGAIIKAIRKESIGCSRRQLARFLNNNIPEGTPACPKEPVWTKRGISNLESGDSPMLRHCLQALFTMKVSMEYLFDVTLWMRELNNKIKEKAEVDVEDSDKILWTTSSKDE